MADGGGSRGRSRSVWRPFVGAMVIGALAGCSVGDTSGTPSRSDWRANTTAMLRRGIHQDSGAPVLLMPAAAAGDAYTTSMAMIALGTDADRASQGTGHTPTDAMRGVTTVKSIQASVAGPGPTVEAITVADRSHHFLDDAGTDVLHQEVDVALADVDTDIYSDVALARATTSLQYRSEEASSRLTRSLAAQQISCVGSEAAYLVGDVITVRPAMPGCSPAQVRTLFDTELRKLRGELARPAARPGLGEAEMTLALSRIAHAQHYPQADLGALDALFPAFERAAGDTRLDDLTPVAADLALAAAQLGIPWRPTPIMVAHLSAVIRGGGEPQASELDAPTYALVQRTARALGATVPAVKFTGLDPVGALELVLSAPTQSADALTMGARRAAGRSTAGDTVAMRAWSQVGSSACGAQDAVALARRLASRTVDQVGRALALRMLRSCGDQTFDSTIAAVVSGAEKVVAAAGKPGEHRPGLMETWRASATLCALAPEKRPGAKDVWKWYGDDALATGGIATPGSAYPDITQTFALATLTSDAPCESRGTLD